MREKAAQSSRGYHAWVRAKAADDFASFVPVLEKNVELAKREAAYLGWSGREYDYMLDKHDPGLTAVAVGRLKRARPPPERCRPCAAEPRRILGPAHPGVVHLHPGRAAVVVHEDDEGVLGDAPLVEFREEPADVLVDERAQMAYYKAEIALDPGEIDRLEGLTLIPGMPVEAFIRTGERTPLAYLIKPFTDYFARAFRES